MKLEVMKLKAGVFEVFPLGMLKSAGMMAGLGKERRLGSSQKAQVTWIYTGVY